MVKDTFSLQIKIFNIVFTKSVINSAITFSLFLIALYIGFNIYSYSLIKFYLNQNLDFKISHEIDHISYAFTFEGDSLKLVNPAEFEETDLVNITEDPFFLQIYTLDGNLLLQSRNLKQFESIELEYPTFTEEYYFKDARSDKSALRNGYRKLYNEQGKLVAYLQLSSLKNSFNAMLENIVRLNMMTSPLVLIIIILISVFISKRAFAPINKIINLANNISTTNLNERLNYKADANDELGKLRDTLNNLFMRLDEQIKQISSFTDNASHQLMTPITAIKTELEYIMRNKKSAADFEQSLPILKEQTERLINIIQSLLLLSKSEKDVLMQNSVFNLSLLINNKIRKRFEHDQIDYFIEDEIYVRGKEDYFLHALNNVVDNAIKYSQQNEKVVIKAKRNIDQIIIAVADKGFGISDSEKEKIFERFYRSTEIEKLGIKGHGLGLSLAKAIVTVMNGSIAVENNIPKGSVFIISLPSVEIT